jgi:hypothetical protein
MSLRPEFEGGRDDASWPKPPVRISIHKFRRPPGDSAGREPAMSRTDDLRMIARVVQFFYEHRLKQAQISERLHVSRATISRLLKKG